MRASGAHRARADPAGVVEARADDVIHAPSGRYAGNQLADEESGERGVYLPDPARVLGSLSRHLRSDAIVALQELDMSQVSQVPASDLFMQARRWILEAFAAAGAKLDMGTKLYTTFLRAGLPAPNTIAATQVACGPTSPGYEYMVGVLRSLLPLIERSGVANVAEIGIDILAARLRDDAVANDRVIFLPRIVGAWARLT